MQNNERTLPENYSEAPHQKADLADRIGQPARLEAELYEESEEASEIPVVIMVPKGVPDSALHD